MTKEEQRQKQLEIRRNLSSQKVEQKSRVIADKLLQIPEFKEARTTLIYISFRNEVRTKDVIKSMLKEDKGVVVPITKESQNKLDLSELKDFEKELEPGTYGILEPKEQYQRLISPQSLDLIIVPGVAFDERGNRIGYGGGYYDRLLASVSQVNIIALAFEEQLVNQIEVSDYDEGVNKIITEQRKIDCK